MSNFEERIFLESKEVLGLSGFGHLSLVRRWVEVTDSGQVNNIYRPDKFTPTGYTYELSYDTVIHGDSTVTSSDLITEAGLRLFGSIDDYNTGTTPETKNSVDITSLLLNGKYGSLDAAWAGMKSYVQGINNSHYAYEVPDGQENHTANSGATILSALNDAGVDVRRIPAAPGNSGYYLDNYYSFRFPGASNRSDPTLLGSNNLHFDYAVKEPP